MKKKLDYQKREVANIFDEVSLWSAPFGRLLLEHIPMQAKAKILDIGFGTGFPLVELSQRFGQGSYIYGIDIWQAGIDRTREKIELLKLDNITILEESAEKIRLEDNSLDLITSNLGANNFDNKEEVYREIHRVLKKGGKLALTTNPIGTFAELFEIFAVLFREMGLVAAENELKSYIAHRNTKEGIVSEIESPGLRLSKSIADKSSYRFVDAAALLNHSLIRIGFRASWENLLEEREREAFFDRLRIKLQEIIRSKGEFSMSVPMLYLEFEKV
ncbi:MAG: class I SAM-dependent methyltransferase [Bacteroidota bacterium]